MRTFIHLTGEANIAVTIDPNTIMVFERNNTAGVTALHLLSGHTINVKETPDTIMIKINSIAMTKDNQSSVVSVGLK